MTTTLNTCECGNAIDYREMGEGATACEWCTYGDPFDGIMWRKAIGADWLEQMETHGFDTLYTVRIKGHKEISVFANSRPIARYIAKQHYGVQD